MYTFTILSFTSVSIIIKSVSIILEFEMCPIGDNTFMSSFPHTASDSYQLNGNSVLMYIFTILSFLTKYGASHV